MPTDINPHPVQIADRTREALLEAAKRGQDGMTWKQLEDYVGVSSIRLNEILRDDPFIEFAWIGTPKTNEVVRLTRGYLVKMYGILG